MEKSDFDRLMERYLAGQVSPPERARIEAWLDAMGNEDNTDLELSKEEEERIFNKLTSSVTSVKELAALKPRRNMRPDQWIIRIAASLLIVSVLSYVVWHFSAARESWRGVASENSVEKIILNDGSLVWLRGESSEVRYHENRDEDTRFATLQGEALFEVAKDVDRPFIVRCGNASVRVVGTSFSLRETPDLVEVTVLTGKVNLSSSGNPDGIDVLPQEKGVYRSNGALEKTITNEQEIASLTANTEYNMRFANTGIGEVFERLEHKFDVSIELADPAIGNCRITIDLTDRSLDNSLRLISEVLNFQYADGPKKIFVTGTGCR